MPKVSIIVPVYNVEKHIEKCLQSLVNQTMNDIEIIIVNDGTIDNSEEIINKYIEKYSDIIKYYKKENTGLSDTRNYAVTKAKGQYIMFVDSDDYIDTMLLENLEDYMEQNVDLIKFKLNIVNEKKEIINKIEGPVFEEISGEEAFQRMSTSDVMLEVACIYLYRRDFFINNKFKFAINMYHEDFGLIPLVIVKAKSVISTGIYGYYYMQTDNSITRNQDYSKKVKRANDVLTHYENMIKEIKKCNISDTTKEKIKNYFINSVLDRASELTGKEQKEYIKKIKQERVINQIKIYNIKQLIKKCILKINVKVWISIKNKK